MLKISVNLSNDCGGDQLHYNARGVRVLDKFGYLIFGSGFGRLPK